MLIGKVIGNVWSTKKKDEISALRLLLVQPLGNDMAPAGNVLVTADEVGAGFGETVIVTCGAPAMQAFRKEVLIPVDAAVVGIVDNIDMADEAASRKK